MRLKQFEYARVQCTLDYIHSLVLCVYVIAFSALGVPLRVLCFPFPLANSYQFEEETKCERGSSLGKVRALRQECMEGMGGDE